MNPFIEFGSRSAELSRLYQVKSQCSVAKTLRWDYYHLRPLTLDQALGIRWPSRQEDGRNANKQQRITMFDACAVSWRQAEMRSRLIRDMHWEPRFTPSHLPMYTCNVVRREAREDAYACGSTESTARQKIFLGFPKKKKNPPRKEKKSNKAKRRFCLASAGTRTMTLLAMREAGGGKHAVFGQPIMKGACITRGSMASPDMQGLSHITAALTDEPSSQPLQFISSFWTYMPAQPHSSKCFVFILPTPVLQQHQFL